MSIFNRKIVTRLTPINQQARKAGKGKVKAQSAGPLERTIRCDRCDRYILESCFEIHKEQCVKPGSR